MKNIILNNKIENNLLLLEFQGSFDYSIENLNENQFTMKKESEDIYNILVNNTIIIGKKVKLDKKLLIAKKNTNGGEVISLVDSKILFKDRPIPLIEQNIISN